MSLENLSRSEDLGMWNRSAQRRNTTTSTDVILVRKQLRVHLQSCPTTAMYAFSDARRSKRIPMFVDVAVATFL